MTIKIEVSREWLGDLQTFLEEAFDGSLAGIVQEECGIQIKHVRALLAATEAPRQEPVMKLEAERLWGGAGEYAVSFVKSGWLDECRKSGGTFMLYAAPLSPDHSGGGAGVVLPEGWKAVPIEPTELMIRRGDQNYSWSVAKIYKAMIEDAPSLDKVKELNQ